MDQQLDLTKNIRMRDEMAWQAVIEIIERDEATERGECRSITDCKLTALS